MSGAFENREVTMSLPEIVEELYHSHKNSLILNPTENIPWSSTIETDFLQGMYLPEFDRNADDKVIFAGRPSINGVHGNLYRLWHELLGTTKVSMKYHSGLDAHIILFMSISEIGDKVLLLPEIAGGHFSTHQILERLGLDIIEIPVLIEEQRVDSETTLKIIDQQKPKFIFIDRSEGLNYEDFSWLNGHKELCKIYDASQYLTHIIAKHYQSPFQMGFDVIVSTLHKNYPGYQKAAVFAQEDSPYWEKIEMGLKTYISNIHPKDIFDILLATPTLDTITSYSSTVLSNAQELDSALKERQVPVVERDCGAPNTQHIWIQAESQSKAYTFFRNLEELRFLTNYRLLPYNLGYGLRLGTAGATRQGLKPSDTAYVAEIIAAVWHEDKLTDRIRTRARDVIAKIQSVATED